MTATLAAIRPDDWNFPLILHVLGAMLLVGALMTAAYMLLLDRSDDTFTLRRVGFRTLLLAALPSFIVMRVAAQWIYDREGFSGENDPAWIGIGYITGDGGALLLLLALITGGLGVRRRSRGLATAAGVFSTLLLVAYLVAVWAMTAKPD